MGRKEETEINTEWMNENVNKVQSIGDEYLNINSYFIAALAFFYRIYLDKYRPHHPSIPIKNQNKNIH